MSMLQFEWVTTEEGLDALRPGWTALGDDQDPGAVFRSWEWQASWWRTLGRRRGRELRVLVGRGEDGAVRGIVPAYVERAPVGGVVPRRRLRLLGDITVGSDYLGLVAHRGERALIAAPFARQLAADPLLRKVDMIELLDLREDEPFALALGGALEGAGFVDLDVPRRYICPVADWGLDLDAYLAARPQKFGSQVRRRRQELSRKPGFHLEVVSEPDAVVAGLEDLFHLHHRRWEEEGGSEAFTSRAVEAFHRRSARLLAERGFARLARLSIDGKPAAAGYGFLYGTRFDYYQTGLAPEWRRRSAGMVILVELMRHAAAGGARELDFLRGNESYKATWATTARATCAVHARRATRAAWGAARAVAALERLRVSVKARLPESAIEALRRLRTRIQQGASP
jgi:CelD/BcsL family acetyltransferase involved in cellulose biosynthesis